MRVWTCYDGKLVFIDEGKGAATVGVIKKDSSKFAQFIVDALNAAERHRERDQHQCCVPFGLQERFAYRTGQRDYSTGDPDPTTGREGDW